MKKSPSYMHLWALAILFIASSIAMNAQGLVDRTDVPRTISYQGLLTSSDGTPFADGQYEITVTLYSDGRGDSPVWQDNYLAEVTGGVFNVLIGSGSTALPSSENLSTPLWIGTSVNGAPEMRPLTPMTASPYALNVPDRAITTNKLAEKSVTAEKVDMDYISGLEIDGMPVSGKGAVLKLKSSEKIALTYDEVTQTVLIDEASHATGTTGDGKDATAQAGTNVLWSDGGDTWTVTGGAASTPTAASWIGTQGAIPFNLRTGNTPVMTYHGGPDPNVQGGNGNTVAAASVGSTIAGGGGGSNITGDYDAIGGGFNNNINDGDYNAISGGSVNAINDGDWNAIGGGQGNIVSTAANLTNYGTVGGGSLNVVLGTYGTVGGGSDNQVTAGSVMGTVGGGGNNRVQAPEATIAGGHGNSIESYVAAITGGHDNIIGPASDAAFIGGGRTNNIQNGNISTIGGGEGHLINAPEATIAGGHFNTVDAYVGTVAGGHNNTVGTTGDAGFVGGGRTNLVNASSGAIGGGDENRINDGSNYSFIGGGQRNLIPNASLNGTIGGGSDNVLNSGSDGAFIGGGANNVISGNGSVISGGTNNSLTGPISAIGGGDGHTINAPEAVIAGGHINTVESYAGSIVGGHDNVVGVGSDYGFVGGGQMNILTGATHSTVGGGMNNRVDAPMATIGGGADNWITNGGAEATIAGGHVNRVESYVSAITGGHDNVIGLNAPQSFIGGGRMNVINTAYGVIGGGQENTVNGTHATIVGGDLNVTDPSYAQTVAGFYNAPRGAAVGLRPAAGMVAVTDDPLFMVGNGSAPVRSNAYEVSYNGHATVFDNNGSGLAGGRPAFRGARYEDNTIYAWGCVDGDGTVVDDFGVASVTHVGPGTYLVTLNYLDRYAVPQTNMLAGGICPVATIRDGECGFISVTCSTGPTNTFTVITKSPDPDCREVDLPFTFHVTGRP